MKDFISMIGAMISFTQGISHNLNYSTPFAYYIRIIIAGVTMEQWPIYMKEVYRILKPGNGWVQCIESTLLLCEDSSVPEDAAYWKVGYVQLFLTVDASGHQEEPFSPFSKWRTS